MLQVALSNESISHKKSSKDDSSKKDGEFKDLFAKIVTKGITKKEDDTDKKDFKILQLKKLSSDEKKESTPTLNNLLNSILQASKKTQDLPLKDLELKDKLLKAKNILESKLNRKIDIKELKDTKSLRALIIEANKKGLNITKVTFEKIQTDKQELKDTKQAKSKDQDLKIDDKKERNRPLRMVAHSSIAASVLDSSKQTKAIDNKTGKSRDILAQLLSKKEQTTKEVRTTLSHILSNHAKDRDEKIDLKTLLNSESQRQREGTQTRPNSGQSTLQSTIQALIDGNQKKAEDAAFARRQLNTNQSDRVIDRLLNDRFNLQQDSKDRVASQREFANAILNSKLSLSGANESGTKVDGELERADNEVAKDMKVSTSQVGSVANRASQPFNPSSVVNHFASSLKEQVDNYKPPISRLSLTLNPKNLGEVDVVIKSRGDSLTVQINSATAPALQILAQNSMELRQNLLSMGFDNLSMQFSSGNKERQQQQGFEHKQGKVYDEDELDEQIIDELEQIEINIPKYV